MPLISFPYTFYFFSPFSYFFSLLLLFLFRLPLISFLPSCCINNGLISGKVLVDYRIKCSLTLLKSPFIDVEPRFSVYEWRFIDVERTFNVYERRFYLSINVSFLSWKNCFSRLKSLFYPSSYSHSFVFLLSFTLNKRWKRLYHASTSIITSLCRLDSLSGVSWQKEGLDFLTKIQPFFVKQLLLYYIYI